MQRTGRPIAPLAQPGYYRGFSTRDQRKFSDAKTREVVLGRVTNIPSIRFFTPEEARLLEIVCAHVIPQDDRDEAHRIPIVPTIDERLYEDRHDGYRYADMPPDQEAFRLGLQAIEQIAQHLHERSFVDLDALDGDRLLAMLHDGNPPAGGEIWQRMAVHRFWMLLIQYCIDTYYAHPWAWDEIGFDGPAYPRAYMRLEHGEPESWEVNERRYEWTAPASSVSDIYEPTPSAIEYPSPHPPKAPAAHAMTEEFYETDSKRGFARGFAIQTVGPRQIAFARQMTSAKGAWGWGLRHVMMDYNHWATHRVARRVAAACGQPRRISR